MSTSDGQDEYLSSVKELYRRRLRLLEQRFARQGDNTPPEIVMEMEDIQAKIDELDRRLAGEPIIHSPHVNTPVEQSIKQNNVLSPASNKLLLPIILGAVIMIAVIGWLANYYGEMRGRQDTNAAVLPTINALQTRVASSSTPDSIPTTSIITVTQIIEATPQPTNSILFPVDAAKKFWQSTGISISKSDKVTITVVGGKWTGQRRNLSNESQISEAIRAKGTIWQYELGENSGEGVGLSCHACPLDVNDHSTALIARIGMSNPFEVGLNDTFIASESGDIFLRMNTQDTNTPEGVLAVEIKVERQPDQ